MSLLPPVDQGAGSSRTRASEAWISDL